MLKTSKVSIPGRIMFLLMNDDSFFQEVMKLKKASSAGSFPKYDQWCDQEGFHMEFALAGYSKSDIQVQFFGQEIIIKSAKNNLENSTEKEVSSSTEESFVPSSKVQFGSISRGIARRNFTSSFLISQEFDVGSTKATVKDGLLHLLIPERKEQNINVIEVVNGE